MSNVSHDVTQFSDPSNESDMAATGLGLRGIANSVLVRAANQQGSPRQPTLQAGQASELTHWNSQYILSLLIPRRNSAPDGGFYSLIRLAC